MSRLRELVDAGVPDRARAATPPTSTTSRNWPKLCRRGFTDQLVLSQDASCYIDWIDPNVADPLRFLSPQWTG